MKHKNNRTIYLYLIRDSRGRVRYVGATIAPKKREYTHRTFWGGVIKQLGEGTFEVVEKYRSRKKALAREWRLIEAFWPAGMCDYNLTINKPGWLSLRMRQWDKHTPRANNLWVKNLITHTA